MGEIVLWSLGVGRKASIAALVSWIRVSFGSPSQECANPLQLVVMPTGVEIIGTSKITTIGDKLMNWIPFLSEA